MIVLLSWLNLQRFLLSEIPQATAPGESDEALFQLGGSNVACMMDASRMNGGVPFYLGTTRFLGCNTASTFRSMLVVI